MISMDDTTQNQGKTFFGNTLYGCSFSSASVTAHYCQTHKATAIHPVSVFSQRQNILNVFLGSSLTAAKVSKNAASQISAVCNRTHSKITTVAGNIPETRSPGRGLLSLQRYGKGWNEICCTDKGETKNQTQGTNVSFPLQITKSPAWVRFCDLGRGFNSMILI